MGDLQIILVAIAFVTILILVSIGAGFSRIQKQQDRIWELTYEHFEGLREYLYEIDRQFDDERDYEASLIDGDEWAGKHLHDLEKEKKEDGRRTLRTRFGK